MPRPPSPAPRERRHSRRTDLRWLACAVLFGTAAAGTVAAAPATRPDPGLISQAERAAGMQARTSIAAALPGAFCPPRGGAASLFTTISAAAGFGLAAFAALRLAPRPVLERDPHP